MPGLGQSNGKFNSLTVDGDTTLGTEGAATVQLTVNGKVTLGNTGNVGDVCMYINDETTWVNNNLTTSTVAGRGNLIVGGDTTLGTQDTGNETHINGSLVVDMDRGLDGVDDHPQLRIHAANGEVGPISNPDGTVTPASWTTARVIMDKGPNNHHAILDIGNVDREWYYLNLHSNSRVDIFIDRSGGGSGVQPRLRITKLETLVNNDFKVIGNTTLGGPTVTIDGIVDMPGLMNVSNSLFSSLSAGSLYEDSGFVKVKS
jgi:hypothetical protein